MPLLVSDGDSPHDLRVKEGPHELHNSYQSDRFCQRFHVPGSPTKREQCPTQKTLNSIDMSLMGTVPVIYFHDFWSSPHHLFPGTVPVILGPVPAISRDFGDSPHHFPYTNDTSQNFANQPLVSHVPRNLQ